MLSRWFHKKSPFEHDDPAVRLTAIASSNDHQAQKIQAYLEQLALNDPDIRVQQAAIAKVSNVDTLATLLEHAELAESVAHRITQRLKANGTTAYSHHPVVINARINAAEGAELETLWPLLQKASQCATLAIRLRDDAKTKILKHPLLQTEIGLTELVEQARGRDKAVYRHARAELARLKKVRGDANALFLRIAELDRSIEKANQSGENTLVEHQRLIILADRRRAAVDEYQSLIPLLNHFDAKQALSIPEDPLKGVELTAPQPAADLFPALLGEVSSLSEKMRLGEPIQKITPAYEQFQNAWIDLISTRTPNTAQHATVTAIAHQFTNYRRACAQLAATAESRAQAPQELVSTEAYNEALSIELAARQKWHKRWQKKIGQLHWPAEHQPPAEFAALLETLNRIESEIRIIAGKQKQAEQSLNETLSAAAQAIEEGQIESAQQQLGRARALQKIGIRSAEKELTGLSKKVAELRDWQQFATSPKRQTLIDEIKKIAETPLAPTEQADQLKLLRQQWRELGRPNSASDIQLHKLFDQLAETAFEPCRVYFAQQRENRSANLTKRIGLCEQLESYINQTDWPTADIRAADKILRHARAEWRLHHPCDRQALKPVQERFNGLQETLYDHLKRAWDANIATKSAIVEAAKALIDQDGPGQGAVGIVKTLQKQWQAVGPTPRGPDQRLWREFRTACDAVFVALDAQHQALKVASNERNLKLDIALKTLNQAVTDGEASRKKLAELNQALTLAAQNIDLSQTQQKNIENAQRAYQQALQGQDRLVAKAKLKQMLDWDQQVSLAEKNQLDIPTPHKIFADRANGQAEPQDWLNLVLEAELAAQITSPAEDQSARMALQIHFMNAGIRDLSADGYEDLLHRWCAAGPKNDLSDILRQRFLAALEHRI